METKYMKNFTIGPVAMDEEILAVGARQLPYFRTKEFSRVMLENEEMLLKTIGAGERSRAVFLTCSGTGAMEAAVVNLFGRRDKILVVNGGSFGERFAEICKIHRIPFEEIYLPRGKAMREKDLAKYDGENFTGFLVNIHETSTGVLYDKELISSFCKRNGCKLVVDAISSFLADPFNMAEIGATAVIIGSQKAIALPPGVAVVVLSPEGVDIVQKNVPECLYFDLSRALKDGERGQTPFTPAVGVLLQMYKRLQIICEQGIEKSLLRSKSIAEFFRKKIAPFPFEIASESPSNALTALSPTSSCKLSAYRIFEILKDEYGIFVCPNGGDMKDKIFRVGHIGALSEADISDLISAFSQMQKKGEI